MPRSAFSLKIFAGYLLGLGVLLAVAPNVLLTAFGVAATSEVWIRVLGLVVVNLSVYYWFAAKAESTPLFLATVYTRTFILVAFAALAFLGLAEPTLVLFGAVDAVGGAWTYLSVRRDQRTRSLSA